MDITALKIRDMRTMLDKKEISAAELTDAYLDRIDKLTAVSKVISPLLPMKLKPLP